MKKILIAFLTLAALAWSTPASAASWVAVVGSADGENKLYYDTETVTIQGSNAMTWAKMVDQDGTYSMSLIAMRCTTRSYSMVRLVSYKKNGSIEHDLSEYVNKEWQPVIPESMMEALFDNVCSRSLADA